MVAGPCGGGEPVRLQCDRDGALKIILPQDQGVAAGADVNVTHGVMVARVGRGVARTLIGREVRCPSGPRSSMSRSVLPECLIDVDSADAIKLVEQATSAFGHKSDASAQSKEARAR